MSIKNLKWKRITTELQELKKAKKVFDFQYERALSVENFNNIINTIVIEECGKIIKKLARKFKFSYEEAVKVVIQTRSDELNAIFDSIDENEVVDDTVPDNEIKPIYTKITIGKKTAFINEKNNDLNIYDTNMKIIGEIKIEKKYNLFK
jgi:hypothetical protein